MVDQTLDFVVGDFNELVRDGEFPSGPVCNFIGRDPSEHACLFVDFPAGNFAADDDIVDLEFRDFGTISSSYFGVGERIRTELTRLAARGFDVSAFEKGIADSLASTSSYSHLLDESGLVAVDPSVCADIDKAFLLQFQVDGDIRTANWFLDELVNARRAFERDSKVEARTLKSTDETDSSNSLRGFITFAADPSELREKSRAALERVQSHVEARDMSAAARVLNEAKAFSGRMHLLSCLIRRGTLSEVSAS